MRKKRKIYYHYFWMIHYSIIFFLHVLFFLHYFSYMNKSIMSKFVIDFFFAMVLLIVLSFFKLDLLNNFPHIWSGKVMVIVKFLFWKYFKIFTEILFRNIDGMEFFCTIRGMYKFKLLLVYNFIPCFTHFELYTYILIQRRKKFFKIRLVIHKCVNIMHNYKS